MRLVLIDLLRRQPKGSALLAVTLAAVWLLAGYGRPSVAGAFGASLACAYLVGPFTNGWRTPSAVWYLPVSRRDIWRATWLVSTLGATTLTTTVKLLTMLSPAARGQIGFSRLALSSVYDFAYTGAGCGLMMLLAILRSTHTIERRLKGALTGLTVIVFIGGAYWGFGLRHMLPTRWSDLSLTAAVTLVVALSVEVSVYFFSPQQGTVAKIYGGRRPGSTRRAASSAAWNGLTGVPRLLWNEAAWTLMLIGVLLVVFIPLVLGIDAMFRTTPNAPRALYVELLRVFDGGSPSSRAETPDVYFWLAFIALGNTARFETMLRHLRSLPLRTAQLNAILVGWPVAVCLMSWAALLALHLVVLRQRPVSLRLDLLVAVIGVTTLVRSITLRWQARFGTVMWLFILGVTPLYILRSPPAAALPYAGVASLVIAVLMNERTLLRSATYRNIRPAVRPQAG